jgi:hypothetical protein
MPREQARELLSSIKDESGLDAGLLAAARKVVIASGAGSVAVGGEVRGSNIVTGSGNVVSAQAGGDLVYGDKMVIHKAPRLVALAVIAAALIVTLVTYLYFNRTDGVYRVRATVINPQGVPGEENKIKVWSDAGGEPKRVEGGWQFDIPAATKPLNGKLTIYASHPDAFLTGRADLTLDKDLNPTVTIKLSRDTSAKVRGQVTDTRGRAVAGARVFVVGYESEEVITKEGGNFELPAHAAENQPIEVVAEKRGVGVARLNHPAGDTPVRLILLR